MGEFFGFFQDNAEGAFVFFACLGAAIFAINWLVWIFGAGRFAQPRDAAGLVLSQPKTQALRYLITEALTKIINDFRHLLALILVLIFGLALAYSLSQAGGDMEEIKEALQAVTATLGGLVGSIIGYYFGESKANVGNPGGGSGPASGGGTTTVLPPPAVQGSTTVEDGSIRAVSRPAPVPALEEVEAVEAVEATAPPAPAPQ